MSASWLFWAVFDQSDCAAASAAAWFPFKDAGSSLGKLLPWRQESRRRDGVRCGVRLMRSKVLNVFKVFLPHQNNFTGNRLPVAWLQEYSKNSDWSAAVCRTTSGRLRCQQTISSVSSTGTHAPTPVLHNTRTGRPVTDTDVQHSWVAGTTWWPRPTRHVSPQTSAFPDYLCSKISF